MITDQIHPPKDKEPLAVRVIEDDTLSSFEKKTIRFGSWGLAVASLSLLAAFVAGYLVYKQFKEMSKQTCLLNQSLQQAKLDSETASAATRQQVTLLQAQINEQQSEMRLDQRAWLGLLTAMPPALSPGDTRSLKVTISNTGKTPALDVYQVADMVLIPDHEIMDAAAHLRSKKMVYAGTIAPGATREITVSNFVIDPQHLADLKSGTTKLYIFANFTFRDISKNFHHLHFCLRLKMNNGGYFAAESSYNDAN